MKHLFLSMAAVAMLASCSSEEVLDKAQTPKSAIGFSTFVDKSTRATDVTTDNLQSFEVNGWRDDYQNFKDQTVNKKIEGQTITWEYTPVQYWENDYTYTFEAIAPGTKVKNGEKEKGVSIKTYKKTGSTISFDYTINDGETDLIYANPVTEKGDADRTDKVGFTFNHLLARVKFSFKNGFPSNAAAVLSISNLKIKNAYTKGEITPSAASAAWVVTETSGQGEISFVGPADISAQNAGETPHKYMIPTKVDNASYTVTFTVTLDQNGAETDYSFSSTIPVNMVMGHSYDYVAEITPNNIVAGGLQPIVFNVTSVAGWGNWEDENGNTGDNKEIEWTAGNGTQTPAP